MAFHGSKAAISAVVLGWSVCLMLHKSSASLLDWWYWPTDWAQLCCKAEDVCVCTEGKLMNTSLDRHWRKALVPAVVEMKAADVDLFIVELLFWNLYTDERRTAHFHVVTLWITAGLLSDVYKLNSLLLFNKKWINKPTYLTQRWIKTTQQYRWCEYKLISATELN